jgi:pyruvate dehydrogenase E1 component alpha subunit
LRARLIADGIASDEALAALEADFQKQIESACEAAFAADMPGIAELKRDVFAHDIS